MLEKYMFPVTTRKVYVEDFMKGKLKGTTDYKAIFHEDKNRLIAVMKRFHRIITNREVIMPLMEELEKLDTSWLIDSSHSFCSDQRMRLQITFPELTLNDGRSDIALSLFLHNSYNGAEGVRMLWGAFRGLCSNGMVFGEILSKFYHERIEILKRLKVTDVIRTEVDDKMGKGIAKHIDEQPRALNQWILYNHIAYYISHTVQQHMRAQYQLSLSRLFKL